MRSARNHGYGLRLTLFDANPAPMLAKRNVDLSRFRAVPVAHLSGLSFESQRAFPAQC